MAAFMHAGPGLSLPAYLGAIGPGIWAAYQKMVFSFPVVTKSIITGITYVIGDMLAQVVQIRSTKAITVKLSRVPRNSEPLLLMDPWRYIRSGLVGLILLGPLAHYYYEFVAIYCESWAFPFKIALDQTLYLAFYNTVYYLVLGVLAGRSLVDVAYVYKAQFMNLLVAGWKLWPAVGVITYNFIPTEHRVLFVDAIEIAYSAVLSTLSNDDPHGEKQK
ncbi:hypothetical protein AB1Y20_007672 [Prymnesium parvum]|uniref:Uncharacterized protein n=1 Tax=Prymnesium parvum TaxID=97485 RepID=A0AB34IXL8_PRYPA